MLKTNLEKFVFDSLHEMIFNEQTRLDERNIDMKVTMVDVNMFMYYLRRNYKGSRLDLENLNSTLGSMNRRLIIKRYSINGRSPSTIGIGNNGYKYLESLK